jgi:hypothetical protein
VTAAAAISWRGVTHPRCIGCYTLFYFNTSTTVCGQVCIKSQFIHKTDDFRTPALVVTQTVHRLQIRMSVLIKSTKSQSWDRTFQMDRGHYHLKYNVLESTSYFILLANKNCFTEWYAKLALQARTLIRVPCCAVLLAVNSEFEI